ncbi:hypothetical protein PIB30_010162 [Stylosanthes scabra]|uniref:Uncharacterized protein n=1 Tax=Stylosanthes scabra TaxID=79078 RepID=A0ABU6Q6G7_9FABA|nr:hypothetical protein [Stylosanthes scabra]
MEAGVSSPLQPRIAAASSHDSAVVVLDGVPVEAPVVVAMSEKREICSFARRLASLAVSRLRPSLPLVVTAYRLCPIAAFPLNQICGF